MPSTVELFKQYPNQVFFETGTYVGASVHNALIAGFHHVYSVEVDRKMAEAVTATFKDDRRVQILNCRSDEAMYQLLPKIKCPITFWLDAHQADIFSPDNKQLSQCPILDELAIIAQRRNPGDVILIDDVHMFGTPEFGNVSLKQVTDYIVSNMDQRYAITYTTTTQGANNVLVAKTTLPGDKHVMPKIWSSEQLDFLHSIISSEALAMLLLDRLARNTSASVIRMADGEKRIIKCADPTYPIESFLADKYWLQEYGLTGCDLRKLGRDLLQAGKDADFLAVPISGLYLSWFELSSIFPYRKYVDQFYPRVFLACMRIQQLLKDTKTIILHNDAKNVALALEQKYKLAPMDYFPLSNWDQHPQAMDAVDKSQCKIVLMSGGPSSKPLAVNMAKQLNKIVLDIGSEMNFAWTSNLVF